MFLSPEFVSVVGLSGLAGEEITTQALLLWPHLSPEGLLSDRAWHGTVRRPGLTW